VGSGVAEEGEEVSEEGEVAVAAVVSGAVKNRLNEEKKFEKLSLMSISCCSASLLKYHCLTNEIIFVWKSICMIV
jgi:hypothetical protein